MALRPGRSRVQHPEVSGIRELARADLAVLAAPRPVQTLATLRDNHHRIARAVASGMSNYEVAETCGVSYNRVSMFRQDPAFMELVAHYRAILTDEWKSAADPVVGFLSSIRTKSLAMIEEKIDAAAEANEFLPSRDLATFAELGLDRTGYGKVNKNVNINVDFAAQLEAARKRSAGARQIEASVVPTLAPQSPSRAEHTPVPPSTVSPPTPRILRRV